MTLLRVPTIFTEAFGGGAAKVRVNIGFTESLIDGTPKARVNLVLVETLMAAPPEDVMSTIPFPGFGNSVSDPSVPAGADPFNTPLPGLTFSVHKKPAFNTRINVSSSGYEVRNAMQEFPRWDFELEYSFLEDRTGADSSLRTIMGFFLARQGAFDSFLFKDPDDYMILNSPIGVGDGVTTIFYFGREMAGGFVERIGQVDTDNDIVIGTATVDEAHTIPVTPGPYTIDVGTTNLTDLGVTTDLGVPYIKVTSGLGTGEYMVNETTGVYTFASADQGDSILISYGYEAFGGYEITLPNMVTFDVAPDVGAPITASFQYYFVCRFMEDQMDFEKFADKLWNLQQCEFRSLII